MSYRALNGDCIELMRELASDQFDSVVTDPPYGLEFMGKNWDSFGRDTGNGYTEKPRMTAGRVGGYKNRKTPNHFEAGRPYQLWCEEWASECLRVLKPGGHLVAFGGTRTYHRLTCAIEDAGFEIRDSLHWIYGSGFPKSMDVSKAIDKTACVEREVTGKSPYSANRAPIAEKTKTICRDGGDLPAEFVRQITAPATDDAKTWSGWGTALKPAHEPIVLARKPLSAKTVAANVLEYGTGGINIDGCRVGAGEKLVRPDIKRDDNDVYGKGLGAGVQDEPQGRWPPNVLLTHSPDCIEDLICALDCPVAELDSQSGNLKSPASYIRSSDVSNKDIYGKGKGNKAAGTEQVGFGDIGGASRFFPSFRYQAKAPKSERPRVDGIPAHPTVKPLAIMQWLARLVTPPGGYVLDPFAGTGTTAEACWLEGFDCMLIEQDADYMQLIRERMGKCLESEAA